MPSKLLPGERAVRRRGSIEQGRALEALGHAVEYLADSQVFLPDPLAAQHTQEAIKILKCCSRSVFLECPEVVPVARRLRHWVVSGVSRLARQNA